MRFVDETLAESGSDLFNDSLHGDVSQFLEVDMAETSSDEIDMDNSDNDSSNEEINISGEAVLEHVGDATIEEGMETDCDEQNEAIADDVKDEEIEDVESDEVKSTGRIRKRLIQDTDQEDTTFQRRKSRRIENSYVEEVVDGVNEEESSDIVEVESKPVNKGKRLSTNFHFPSSLPEVPENIDDILKQSAYFSSKKSLIKAYYPSHKQYDMVDDELPDGFKVWEQLRPNGKHLDKEFLTPDGRHILRSKLAVAEYCKVVLGEQEVSISQKPVPSKKGKAAESMKGLKLFKEKVKRSLLKVASKDEVDVVSENDEDEDSQETNEDATHPITNEEIQIDSESDFEMTDGTGNEPETTDEQQTLEASEISVVKCLPKGTKVKFTFVPETPETEKPTAKKYSCSLCKKIFLTRAGFDTHVVKDHKNARPVLTSSGKAAPPVNKMICSHCKQVFLNKTNFMRHMEQEHPEEGKPEKNKSSHPILPSETGKRSFGKLTISVAQKKTPAIISHPAISKPINTIKDGGEQAKGNLGGVTIKEQKKPQLVKAPVMKAPVIIKHPCKFCNRKFTDLADMESHKQFEHSFPCTFCPEVLPTKPKLTEHKKDSHNFACKNCNKKFVRETELEEHKRFEHFFQCPDCVMVLSSKTSLVAHKKKEHSIKCMKCPATFEVYKSLEEHVKKEHYFKCMKCPAKFLAKKSLEEHLIVEHYFKCEHCDIVYESKKSFQTHNEAEHTFPCGECQEIFLTVELCTAHLREKHQSCEDCEDEFSWPGPDHRCFFTKNKITPPSERVIEQNLYRGWFFNSTD